MGKTESLNLLWQLKEVNLFHCNYCKFFFQERSVPQQSLRVESFWFLSLRQDPCLELSESTA